MNQHIPAREYLKRHYIADFQVFGGDMMCGFSLTDSLRPPKREQFAGLTEFVACQFGLNLMSQAIYSHFRSSHAVWRRFSAPFANTLLCFSGHGMGSHLPYAILRFAQQPSATPGTNPIQIGWSILNDYVSFFLNGYVSDFLAAGKERHFCNEEFLGAISTDQDCIACVLTPSGWETKHVMELLSSR